jgi:predicted RecA/RadA family phage recombinase
MSTTKVQDGKTITVTAPTGGLTAGTPHVLRSGTSGRIVIPKNTVDATENVECDAVGVHGLTKATGTGTALSQGDLVYWDGSKITDTASGNDRAGTVTEDAATSDSIVLVDIDKF